MHHPIACGYPFPCRTRTSDLRCAANPLCNLKLQRHFQRTLYAVPAADQLSKDAFASLLITIRPAAAATPKMEFCERYDWQQAFTRLHTMWAADETRNRTAIGASNEGRTMSTCHVTVVMSWRLARPPPRSRFRWSEIHDSEATVSVNGKMFCPKHVIVHLCLRKIICRSFERTIYAGVRTWRQKETECRWSRHGNGRESTSIACLSIPSTELMDTSATDGCGQEKM